MTVGRRTITWPRSCTKTVWQSDEERYGSVDRVLVLCGEDKTMQVEFRRRMIDQNPPQAVKLIGEADHMAMLSRPHERCQCFEDIAKNYC
ncbi:hypothetical protein EUGRSUZ_I01000 [Eucalyptus grandis]|uniref:Uncharacterized protein n=2 Tax=Eucalyptus grandis TaxID=71139 RepID=A0ACC3JE80_EUCGR|nr:hypothetical protein EUGRSUZ_I01000 [Eucalyptus grandis]